LTDEDVDRIEGFLQDNPSIQIEFHVIQSPDGWRIDVGYEDACPFLIDDKCSIHPAKPSQCGTYPFWPEILEYRGAWKEEAKACPGIGLGRRYHSQEIAVLLNEELSTNDVGENS
jgi:hypothetical protein